MRNYTLLEIARAVNGTVTGNAQASINNVSIDSRTAVASTNLLFVCIKGERNNGHLYINKLLNMGVTNFLVDDASKIEAPGNYVVAENSVKALQDWAAHHRSRFSIPVIGITGSNGKTIVKEWIAQLLSPHKEVVRSPKSYNSQVGVPLSVLQIKDTTQVAVFEAGISKPGEMQQLQKIIRPTIGVFTNIGQAHQAFFTSTLQKIKEKALLFAEAQTIVFCADQKELADGLKPGNVNQQLMAWKTGEHGNVKYTLQGNQTAISMRFKDQQVDFTIPFNNQISAENAINAVFALVALGLLPEEAIKNAHRLMPVAMRLEIIKGRNNTTLINDSYNTDPASVKIALDTLRQQHQHSRQTVILSDILHSGLPEPELYQNIAQDINHLKPARFIGIGNSIGKFRSLFTNTEPHFFASTAAFLSAFDSFHFRDETILIKGARPFAFEAITSLLIYKHHRTVLEVNMNALTHNLNYFKGLLQPKTKLMVMVKALSYGSGGFEIANHLAHHGVDCLGVAYADEGVYLRENGIDLPIMVMAPEESSFGTMVSHRLEPVAYSFRLLQAFVQFANHKGLQHFPLHIKVDTGMHRLGFEADELDTLLKTLAQCSSVKAQSVFFAFSSQRQCRVR
ncbi:MAG: bifunctional UDP-N-acetylmuramoyl-tripeptide:D-alanyl-D-alanine ligase/alanine racemase [Bacteroidales bacterium]|nr:bifunctional UDP-N-acetylmuramoyl-tripeptide:D-alanyl-D-alanine ligase/alanine racemase [Bacteroidales bacterium]